MSSRARKILAKKNDLLNELAENADDEEGDIVEITFSKKKGHNRNAFDVV